jgi:hypothetical protein
MRLTLRWIASLRTWSCLECSDSRLASNASCWVCMQATCRPGFRGLRWQCLTTTGKTVDCCSACRGRIGRYSRTPHPFEPIRSFNEFLVIFCRIVGLNQANRETTRYATILESFAGIHFQFENLSCPIVGNALDQPITENDARCILEWLDQVAAIQHETMTVRTPIGVRVIVKAVPEVGCRDLTRRSIENSRC